MKTENRGPAWWQLYLLGLVMIGLLVLGAWAPLSEIGHQMAAIGTLVVVYGLIELWLRVNRRALLHVDELLLSRQPRYKVVREISDEEDVPVCISLSLLPQAEIVKGGNGDHRTDRSVEEISTEPRDASGAQPATDTPITGWEREQ
jgi:hypothetical protein